MNHQSRLLPHLNSYYLQQKAYDFHRKKVQSLKSSSILQKQKRQSLLQQKYKNGSFKIMNKNEQSYIHTIRQQMLTNLNKKITPWQKRMKQQRIKQNLRLNNRILKCESFMNRKELQDRHLKHSIIRERLLKFTSLPSSQKVLLKCKYSLDLIHKKQRQIEDSRLNSKRMYINSACRLNNAQKQVQINYNRINLTEVNKKNNYHDIFQKRNQRKALTHFQNNKKSVSHIYSNFVQDNNELQDKNQKVIRYRTEQSEKFKHKKQQQQIIFATQI